MFDFLKGSAEYIDLTKVTLLCGQVGYALDVPLSVSANLAASKEKKKDTLFNLWIHTHVSQDNIRLFGFESIEARAVFRKIISISGIGPKAGINILSHLPQDQFIEKIQNADLKALVALPGVGKKTAERLVLELKDKLPKANSLPGKDGLGTKPYQGVESDLVSALLDFGFKNAQAEKVSKHIFDELKKEGLATPSLPNLVKLALQKGNSV